jgi:hypothetical protein
MLMWRYLWNNAQNFANVATIATAVIAALAAVFTLGIYFGQRVADRRSFAKGLVREYVELAFNNPRYANPKIAQLDIDARTFDGSREKFEKYERFVDFVLWTDEELLGILKDDRWRASVRFNLENHFAYLKAELYGEYETYFSEELNGMIREVIADARVEQLYRAANPVSAE